MFVVLKSKKIIFSVVLIAVFILVITLCSTVENNLSGVDIAVLSDSYEYNVLPGEAVSVSNNNNFFADAKHNKEIARAKTVEMLQNIIDNENSDMESKSDAESRIISIASDINNEMIIESLITSKGINNVEVFINEKNINVIVEENGLKNEDVAKINDVIYEITGNNNIKIVEVK